MSTITPSGQAVPAQDIAFYKAQVDRAQTMQTVYLLLLALAFIVALVQTFRLRRLLNTTPTGPWSGPWGYW